MIQHPPLLESRFENKGYTVMGTAGRKRKRQQQNASVAGPESCLHKHVLTQIAWGVFSVNQCQQIAREAVRDYEKTSQDPPAASFCFGFFSIWSVKKM